MRANKTCPYCHEEFQPKRTNQIYCIKKHGWDFRNEKKENIWDNEIFKFIKSNDDLLKAVFESPKMNGSCSWNYLMSFGFKAQYMSHQSTVGFLKYTVMLKFGYMRSENGSTTIKRIYE